MGILVDGLQIAIGQEIDQPSRRTERRRVEIQHITTAWDQSVECERPGPAVINELPGKVDARAGNLGRVGSVEEPEKVGQREDAGNGGVLSTLASKRQVVDDDIVAAAKIVSVRVEEG